MDTWRILNGHMGEFRSAWKVYKEDIKFSNPHTKSNCDGNPNIGSRLVHGGRYITYAVQTTIPQLFGSTSDGTRVSRGRNVIITVNHGIVHFPKLVMTGFHDAYSMTKPGLWHGIIQEPLPSACSGSCSECQSPVMPKCRNQNEFWKCRRRGTVIQKSKVKKWQMT
jgi:hypothetical protein